jgi:peptidoglycan/LPS O-acetylase OafA/YrhL
LGQGKALAYRPGLDGIRALAVAAVVLFHGGVEPFSGGFLGVDLFFVLSGFLITSLLLQEQARTGTVDLLRFWLGRARRLLPAALLVIAVSLVAVALLSSEDLPSLRGDALASALYVNNWHQVFADRSYFEAFGRPSLLLHFWSLAVEEQFYLLWPLLLLLGLRFLRPARVALLAVVAAVASGVLMALVFDPSHDPTRVYYGTDTRATPLLAGVALAFVWPAMRGDVRAVGRGARIDLDVMGLAGLALVLYGVFAWEALDPFLYRGGLALTALGGVLLIASASHPASHVGRMLGWAPLVWVGARSYGIYLWHWPVMALTRPDLDVHASMWLLVPAQVAATVALAALSYRFVEMPVRRGEAQARLRGWLGGLSAPRRRVALAAVPAALALFVAGAVAWPAAQRELPVAHTQSALARSAPDAAGLSASASAGGSDAAPARGSAGRRGGDGARGGGASVEQAPSGDAAKPAAAPRGPILAVGASVMLAAIGPLEHRLHARVDAAVARQPAEIVERLQAYRDAGGLPPVVVVQSGENGPLYRDDLLALKHVLRGVPRVVLVNVRSPEASWADDTNEKLDELKSTWPQATVADWHDASDDGDLLYDDGTHPNPAGAAVYARIVRRAIGR